MLVEKIKKCSDEEQICVDSHSDQEELKRKSAKLIDMAVLNEGIKMKLDLIEQHLLQLQQRVDPSLRQIGESSIKKECGRTTSLHEAFNITLEQVDSWSDQLMGLSIGLSNLLVEVWEEKDQFMEAVKVDAVGLNKMKKGSLDVLDKMFERCAKYLLNILNYAKKFEQCYLLFMQRQQQSSPPPLQQHSPQQQQQQPQQHQQQQQQTTNNVTSFMSSKHQFIIMLLNVLNNAYLPELFKRALIIEPMTLKDRILKVSSGKSVSFNAAIRMLGGSSLNLDMVHSKVRTAMYSADNIPQSAAYAKGEFNIVNGDEKGFVLSRTSGACSASFNNIHLVNIKRPERAKADALVTDQKFALVFYARLVCADGSIFENMAVSLPMILISQTSQEIMARGTLTWDAAFSLPNRQKFEYREEVQWSEVATILNNIILFSTGHKLTTKQLHRLAQIVFKDQETTDFSSFSVSEKQIIKDKLSGRDFNFWKWFVACLHLINEHIKPEWQKGLIVGFISREECEKVLIDEQPGTFLLRFSESTMENSQKSGICGDLAMVLVEVDPSNNKKKIFHLKQYLQSSYLESQKSLNRRLSDILKMLKVANPGDPEKKRTLLRYIYPHTNVPLEEILNSLNIGGAYAESASNQSENYVIAKCYIEIMLFPNKKKNNSNNHKNLQHSNSFLDNTTISSLTSPDSNLWDMSPVSDTSQYCDDHSSRSLCRLNSVNSCFESSSNPDNHSFNDNIESNLMYQLVDNIDYKTAALNLQKSFNNNNNSNSSSNNSSNNNSNNNSIELFDNFCKERFLQTNFNNNNNNNSSLHYINDNVKNSNINESDVNNNVFYNNNHITANDNLKNSPVNSECDHFMNINDIGKMHVTGDNINDNNNNLDNNIMNNLDAFEFNGSFAELWDIINTPHGVQFEALPSDDADIMAAFTTLTTTFNNNNNNNNIDINTTATLSI